MHAGARATSSSTTSARLGWLVALALAALHLARGVRTVGTRPRNAAGAFVLHVELEFKTEAAAKELVTAWARCARPDCPCVSFNGLAGEHCCRTCRGTPMSSAKASVSVLFRE